MESLLSLSFDYLSSADGIKIKKGLRQLEGLLAQICLSRSGLSSTAAERRRSMVSMATVIADEGDDAEQRPKALAELEDDPAFREFFKLQEGFEWNVAIRLISCLERLLGKGSNGQNDLLLVSTLDLLLGILLIHPPSRALFSRELYMNLLLDLLDPSSCPAIQSSTILTLVASLLDHPANTRTFESLDGLLTITSLFKSRTTSREVKMKLVEFLYFYLMPETPHSGFGNGNNKNNLNSYSSNNDDNHTPNTAERMQRSPSKRLGAGPAPRSMTGAARNGGAGGGEGGGTKKTRTMEEKQKLLGRYLNNVEDLVEDLRETAPFGAVLT